MAISPLDSAISRTPGMGDGLTDQQRKLLDSKGVQGEERAKMEAQLILQNQQETVAFISNLLKKRNEIMMSIIGNMR
jgi:hypothetical protein